MKDGTRSRNDLHPYVPELEELYRGGGMSRRAFLRNATLLGISAAAARTFVMDCAVSVGARNTARASTTTVEDAGELRRGGKLRVASSVLAVSHPAQFVWGSPSNQMRHVAEHLTYTDGDNITHPWLLDSWTANEDLTEWTLHLRPGITHNNGDAFVADDVVFTMNEWLDGNVGSSMLSLIGSYLSTEGIERVGNYQVKLHLDRPEIAVPEHLFHYPALILNHRTFEGDFLRAPHGTGPYTLEEYSEGERVLLERRDDYWQDGVDGEPLPYLDEIEFIDMGSDTSAWIEAMEAGQVDLLDLGDVGSSADIYQVLKDSRDVIVHPVTTGQARVLRMRVDLEPWTDNRVRQALKLCQDRRNILNAAYFGEGRPGQDFHVAPVHPEYCEKPVPAYDPARASQLLSDAGYPAGLHVELAVGTGWPDVVTYAQILQEDAAAGGFNITINAMPNPQYWEQWTEVGLGITPWTHRPLGTMILSLAYVGDAEGDPVPWNETRWMDEEFSDLLEEANGTLDVEERRAIFCKLEQIQMDRGSVGIAYWMNDWFFYRNCVQDVPVHPSQFLMLHHVWKGHRTYLPLVTNQQR